jgi:hypothetical protein
MPEAVDDSKRKAAAAFNWLWYETRPAAEKQALEPLLSPDVTTMDVASALDAIRDSDARPLLKLRAVASTLKNRPDLYAPNADGFVAVVQAARPDVNGDAIRNGLEAWVRRVTPPPPPPPPDPGTRPDGLTEPPKEAR